MFILVVAIADEAAPSVPKTSTIWEELDAARTRILAV
jgi:hypothetical protein